MTIELPQRNKMGVGETRIAAVNFGPTLDDSDTLTGTPTVVEQTTSDLTISQVTLNSATYEERGSGETVAANTAVKFAVTGGSVANSPYSLLVTASTVAGETLKRLLVLYFE